MIVVKVELHSSNTGEIQEIGRAIICNTGGGKNDTLADYKVFLGRRNTARAVSEYIRDNLQMDKNRSHAVLEKPLKTAMVKNHAKLSESVWKLVQKALNVLDP